MAQAQESKPGRTAPMERLWAENDDRTASDPSLVAAFPIRLTLQCKRVCDFRHLAGS